MIQDRRASVQPMSTGSSSIDCPEYIRQTVQSWRRQLSRPMNIDLYIFNTTANAHILLERWHFAYSQSNETNLDSNNVVQRMQLLVRSLQSFIRLLPGFNLLHVSQVKPLVTVQIYDPKITPENFKYDSSRYNFPAVVTAKGSVSVSVTFTNPSVVKVCTSSYLCLPSSSHFLIANVVPGHFAIYEWRSSCGPTKSSDYKSVKR